MTKQMSIWTFKKLGSDMTKGFPLSFGPHGERGKGSLYTSYMFSPIFERQTDDCESRVLTGLHYLQLQRKPKGYGFWLPKVNQRGLSWTQQHNKCSSS